MLTWYHDCSGVAAFYMREGAHAGCVRVRFGRISHWLERCVSKDSTVVSANACVRTCVCVRVCVRARVRVCKHVGKHGRRRLRAPPAPRHFSSCPSPCACSPARDRGPGLRTNQCRPHEGSQRWLESRRARACMHACVHGRARARTPAPTRPCTPPAGASPAEHPCSQCAAVQLRAPVPTTLSRRRTLATHAHTRIPRTCRGG